MSSRVPWELSSLSCSRKKTCPTRLCAGGSISTRLFRSAMMSDDGACFQSGGRSTFTLIGLRRRNDTVGTPSVVVATVAIAVGAFTDALKT